MNKFLIFSLLAFVLIPLVAGSAYADVGSFSTSGFVKINEYRGASINSEEPISSLEVCVKNILSFGNLLFTNGNAACTQVQSNGFYSLSSVSMPSTPLTIQYVVRTSGDQLDIQNENNNFYKFTDPRTERMEVNYIWQHQVIIPHTSESNKALWVYADWKKFTSYVKDEFRETITLDLDVQYEDNKVDQTSYNSFSKLLKLQGMGLSGANAVDDQWNVYHEMSHHLLNDAYQDSFNTRAYPRTDCPTPHSFYQVSNGGCAFSEGFADMMPHLVMDQTQIDVYSYKQKFNIESPAYYDDDVGWINADDTAFVQGRDVEGRVGATLFDLLDRGNDNDENIRESHRDFWDVVKIFQIDTPTDIDDFYRNWNVEHGYDSNLNQVYILNTITTQFIPQQTATPTLSNIESDSVSFEWLTATSIEPIEKYEIFRSASPKVLIATVPFSQLSYTDDTVSASTTYQYTISAKNQYGDGEESDPLSVTTLEAHTAPNSPTSLQATSGDTQVSLSWDAPSDDGGDSITDYLIEYKLSSESTDWNTFAHGDTSETEIVTGLTNDSSYDFRVSATNEIGTGSASSSVTATPFAPDTTAPVITPPSDKTFEATALYTPLNSTDIGTATVTDDSGETPTIYSNATDTFPLGNTVIIYNATDSSNNTGYANQIITIQDTTKPTITLKGITPINIEINTSYYDVGATAHDNINGNLTLSIVTNNPVDTTILGSYTITYDVKDNSGNDATQVTRIVNVNAIELFCGKEKSYYDYVFNGTDESEYIQGTSKNDLIFGNGGDDLIRTWTGNDCVYGGDGNDMIKLSHGNNIIFGGNDDDFIIIGYSDSTAFGELGDDILLGTSRDSINFLRGGNGTNTCISYHSQNTPKYGNCAITEPTKNITTQVDDTKLYCGQKSTFYDSIIVGTDDSEYIKGTWENDLILALGGDDTIYGYSGADCIYAGEGNDTIQVGRFGHSIVYGEAGNDRIITGWQANTIYGGEGDDIILAVGNENTIYGDGGNDICISERRIYNQTFFDCEISN